ncbi:chromate transporter [Pseudoflavonifractor sp. 60]|uniref:chromate transporter n=1 Tax=Pseudoflavonifractor sp. 60 TaxID=2304576 RepID=UPI00136BEB2D|nr:chromate transporter [Pseudoflavonifractor sp. 60]
MSIYADLFLTFAKVGVCTFGGGYAMLPILQREVVEKKGWATDEELTDYFAVGQCTPGIIAVNTATFIGYKYKGIPGGVLATLGLVFPSLIIITAIAAFLSNFADIPAVRHALAGINAAVVALIAASVLKLGKSTLKNGAAITIFLCVLALAAAGNIVNFGPGTPGAMLDLLTSPAVLIVLAGIMGFALYRNGKGGEGK